MRPHFIHLLLLWAELKKLYLNRTPGKDRGTRSGHQQFKSLKHIRNRLELPIILIGGLLSLESTTRAQSKTSEIETAGNDAPEADTQPTNAPSGLFSSTNGYGSQLPVSLRPFQLVLPRAHLLDDWLGFRSTSEGLGITPTLTFVTDIAGNVTGGKNQGTTHADNLGLDLLFDFDKLFGLKGGSFLASISQRSGASLSKEHVGNVFTIQQVYGGQTFHLIDLAYQQRLFHDSVEIRLGRIAAGDDFLVSPYNWLFMQNGFDGNPVGIFFNAPGMTAYPNAT